MSKGKTEEDSSLYLPESDSSVGILNRGKSSVGRDLEVLFRFDVAELHFAPLVRDVEFFDDDPDFPWIWASPVSEDCQWLQGGHWGGEGNDQPGVIVVLEGIAILISFKDGHSRV